MEKGVDFLIIVVVLVCYYDLKKHDIPLLAGVFTAGLVVFGNWIIMQLVLIIRELLKH